MSRKSATRRQGKKEPKPHVIALRISDRTYDDLVLEAHRQGLRRGTLAAQILDEALRKAE